ncbi:MAG: FIG00995642: hypothetical protein, partial [uncultured Thermomicrobiales bacterium]
RPVRETDLDHPGGGGPDGRRHRRRRGQVRRDLPASLLARRASHPGGDRRWPSRQVDPWRVLGPHLTLAGVLRVRALARHMGDRRGRGAHEPGGPRDRPVSVVHGTGGRGRRPARDPAPRLVHRCRGHRGRDGRLREWRARCDPGGLNLRFQPRLSGGSPWRLGRGRQCLGIPGGQARDQRCLGYSRRSPSPGCLGARGAGPPRFPRVPRPPDSGLPAGDHRDRPPAVTGADARRSLEIMLAIYQSSRTGQPVSLPMV